MKKMYTTRYNTEFHCLEIYEFNNEQNYQTAHQLKPYSDISPESFVIVKELLHYYNQHINLLDSENKRLLNELKKSINANEQ